MTKLLFLLFAPFPALAGFSLGYAIRKTGAPDRVDAMVMSGVFFLLWGASIYFGQRWRRSVGEAQKLLLLLVMAASSVLGVVMFVMTVTGVLG